jgi:hypothetical protein
MVWKYAHHIFRSGDHDGVITSLPVNGCDEVDLLGSS